MKLNFKDAMRSIWTKYGNYKHVWCTYQLYYQYSVIFGLRQLFSCCMNAAWKLTRQLYKPQLWMFAAYQTKPIYSYLFHYRDIILEINGQFTIINIRNCEIFTTIGKRGGPRHCCRPLTWLGCNVYRQHSML